MFNNNLLMGAASASGELVEIGNSALYTTSSQELERTPGSAGNVDKFTFSAWVYLCNPTSGNTPIFGAINTSANQHRIFTNATGTLQFDLYLSNSFVGRLITTQVLRDIGWYHIVAVYDSGNSLADSRMILYLNGERITDFSTETMPSQNQDGLICGTHLHQIGMHDGLSTSMDGYMAEAVLIDGSVLTPTSFGQYDSTENYWTPKSSAAIKALTFGTTGFYLDNTTNAQTDASGEGNNFTNTGSVALSTHTPTNLTALLNPLSPGSYTLSVGNLKFTGGDNNWSNAPATFIIPDGIGKWYCEFDCVSNATSFSVGICAPMNRALSQGAGGNGVYNSGDGLQNQAFVYSANGKVNNNATNFSYGATYGAGDRINIAYDAVNGNLFFGKNGTWQNSATVSEIEAGTGTNAAASSQTGPKLFVASIASTGVALSRFSDDDFVDTPPTDFLALNTTNIAKAITRTHSNLEEYFDTTLYEGNGAGQRVGKFLPFTNSFTVGNSALFNKDNSESLSKTPSGAGSSTTTGTFNVWIKQGQSVSSRGPLIYVDGASSDFQIELNISGNNKLRVDLSYSAANHVKLSTQAFKDTSQWSMVTCILDTSNGTASERIRLYWNSNRLALTTDNTIDQNQAIIIGSAVEHQIGALETSYFYDGYMSEVVYIDGTALEPSNFGQVDTSTGRWIPKDVSGLTFGTNGFYLNFANSSDVGNDVSGNNNDFTNNNTVVQVADTPTVNANVWNSSESGFSGGTFTNGNRTVQTGTSQYAPAQAGLPISSGKWYTEVVPTATSNIASFQIGITKGLTTANTQQLGSLVNDVGYSGQAGNLFYNGESGSGGQSYGASYAVDDVIGMAIDFDANTITFYKNGASQGVITLPDTSTVNTPYFIACNHYDNSSNGTFLLRSLSSDWTGTAPTGHLAIIQDNMPAGESYQTAFSWIKNRDATDSHMLFDRVRGIYNDLHSDAAVSQVTNVNTLQRFLNGGVQVGNDVQVNTVNESYVAWNWYMQTTGSGTSNTDGSTNTEATLVDTNLGLSISKFDSGASGDHTIGHGLGVVPEFVIFKELESANNWAVYHSGAGFSDTQEYLLLNSNGAKGDNGASIWGAAFPTSTVLGFTSGQICNANKDCVALCFAPSQFISMASYLGNGNANGTFITTVNSLGIPIQPAWVMIKRTDAANNWCMRDIVRDIDNPNEKELDADLSNAEITNSDLDILTGGFKLRANDNLFNASGGTYIYLAFGTPIIDVDGRIITGR